MFFETIRDREIYYKRGDNFCEAHFHRAAEILYVVNGTKRAFVDNREYFLRAGEFLVCPPYTLHQFSPSENGEQIVASVPAPFVEPFEKLCKGKTPKDHKQKDEDGGILKLMTALCAPDNDVLFHGLSNAILGIFSSRAQFEAQKNASGNAIAAAVAEYIEENYAKELCLNGLAEHFGYSPNYFSALFKKNFHTGFTQYLNFTRVRKSIPLLYKYQASGVYFLCGFKSPQQYFLNFKRYFGCTPQEYVKGKKR